MQEEEDTYDRVCDAWVISRNATPEQQARMGGPLRRPALQRAASCRAAACAARHVRSRPHPSGERHLSSPTAPASPAVHLSSPPRPLQVAGLRLMLSVLECWLFHYPLTEESLVERLGQWSMDGLDRAPLPGAGAPAGRGELLAEARQAYALGAQ